MADNTINPNAHVTTVAVIGAGIIGLSWASLLAASGRRVHIYDCREDVAQAMDTFWQSVKPTLIELSIAKASTVPDLHFFGTAAEAVTAADFVQECIPERLEAKQQLYREIEPSLGSQAIVATSSSGLRLSDLQSAWRDPSRLIIAHPFNPPHIIPLVELYGNNLTAPGVLAVASDLYSSCGKVTIALKREVLGHVANRLQAALWREAIHLVVQGVASVKDIDLAISAGPGLRWAVMGPHMLLNLGGGALGLRAYCEQFQESYALWWDDLGKPQLDPETIDHLVNGLQEEIDERSYPELVRKRDAKLTAALRAIHHSGASNEHSSV